MTKLNQTQLKDSTCESTCEKAIVHGYKNQQKTNVIECKYSKLEYLNIFYGSNKLPFLAKA